MKYDTVQHTALLCCIVRETYGELAAKLVSRLLQLQECSLQSLLDEFSAEPTKLVCDCLKVLIQHNVVTCHKVNLLLS